MTKRALTVGSLKAGNLTEFTGAVPPLRDERISTTNVQLVQNQTHYEVTPMKGKTLLHASLEQNQILDYKCTKGTCGRCKVKVVDGGGMLSKLNEKEKEKLQALAEEGYRLACQAVFH